MIEQPTVLVLGAGASKPYGFPSGQGLLSSIQDVMLNPANGHNQIGLLTDIGFTEDHIHEFKRGLKLSQTYSVDEFLEHRHEFVDLGKHAIAVELLSCEDEGSFNKSAAREQGIYRYLFDKMKTHFDEFDQNKLSFITFNYDRSLEHFLFTALKHAYGREDVECAEKINGIPIVHVHGSLGALPWQSSTGRSYTPNYTYDVLRAAAAQIVVVSEGEETSDEFEKAFKLLEAAQKVYFLGFGYNDVNLERLNLGALPKYLRQPPLRPPSPPRHTNVMGSSFGLETAQAGRIMGKWRISLPDSDCGCLLFLHRYVEFQ